MNTAKSHEQTSCCVNDQNKKPVPRYSLSQACVAVLTHAATTVVRSRKHVTPKLRRVSLRLRSITCRKRVMSGSRVTCVCVLRREKLRQRTRNTAAVLQRDRGDERA